MKLDEIKRRLEKGQDFDYLSDTRCIDSQQIFSAYYHHQGLDKEEKKAIEAPLVAGASEQDLLKQTSLDEWKIKALCVYREYAQREYIRRKMKEGVDIDDIAAAVDLPRKKIREKMANIKRVAEGKVVTAKERSIRERDRNTSQRLMNIFAMTPFGKSINLQQTI